MSGPIWLIGAGNMGGAMLRGWIACGVDPRSITVVDPYASDLPELVTVLDAVPDGNRPDILVLAVKPQQLGGVAEAYAKAAGAPRLLLSVLAGVETPVLQRSFDADHVVRAMPNLPAAIGQGASVLFSGSNDSGLRSEAAGLMSPLGIVEWIEDESLFDAVTALSGSGPGYVFRFIEAMAEAGSDLGLPHSLAVRLAVATIRGAGLLAEQSGATPAELADRVASPGGTTREGLNVLDQDDALKKLLVRTLAAAKQRSEELASLARG